jgi:Uma2 family endonuclease
MIAEIANTSLDFDRLDKGRIYARAAIPVYWIVNLPDRVVEVYSAPSGPTPLPTYGRKDEYRSGDAVPVALDGQVVGTIPVADLLP